MRALYIAATGMLVQQTHVDVLSQNISNQTTAGYKAQRPEFQDLIYQDLRRVGTNSSDVGTIVPTGVQLGLGAKVSAISRDTSQGTVKQTSNSLDLAIQGNGYFQVNLPDGRIAYTRDGSFKLSAQGEIVTANGYIVQPAITVPNNATDISVNASGEVEVTITGQTAPSNLGQIELAKFINPAGLEAIGENLFLESTGSGTPLLGIANQDGYGSLLQGYTENSNVDSVTAVTDLIVAQRAYEMNSKVIKAADEMLQSLNQSA